MSTLLAVMVNAGFIFGVIAAGLVSINEAFTGFCPIGTLLKRLGFTGALERPEGGNLYFLQTDRWYLERRIYVTVGVNITLGSLLFLPDATCLCLLRRDPDPGTCLLGEAAPPYLTWRWRDLGGGWQ